jgi:malate dehydrogenase (oxaloacetate-decarboxylating)(NADP+)
MGIPVGKLQLYSACGGINPHHCLPVCIDVGTNNEEYLKDEWYQGLRQKRVRGKEYDELIEEFMAACMHRWGRTVLLQFEDFGNVNAFRLLENTRHKGAVFNDDIQGTASVTLSSIIASLHITSKSNNDDGPKTLADHTFVFLGAGEAGTGIAQLIAYAVRVESGGKISMEQARSKIWLVDSQGLVHAGRQGLAHHKQDFAHKLGAELAAGEITSLEDAVRVLKPTALIGVSSMPKTFTPAVLELMAENNAAPLIFALSNPTSQAECTAEECYRYTAGRAIFASGSPFDPVTMVLPSGVKKTFEPAQCNNSYIFPGLGLGVIACGAKEIPDDFLYVAAAALADMNTEADRERGSVCPPLRLIREVSATIAAAVATKAYELKLATVQPKPKDMLAFVKSQMVMPGYGEDAPPHRTKSVL